MIIADLFRNQASPWESLATDHVYRVWTACKTFLKHVLAHVADPGTSTGLIQKIFEPEIDKILVTLEAEAKRIKIHQTMHPIATTTTSLRAAQRVKAVINHHCHTVAIGSCATRLK